MTDPAAGAPRLSPSACYLVHLIACGLAGDAAAALPEGASWERVHALAAWNSVEGVSWAGARSHADAMPAELAKAWAGEADATLWRRLQFDAERERVIAALAEAGFSYMPLKGIYVAPMYPDPSMRAMADNDILYGRIEPDPTGGFRVPGATEAEREEAMRGFTADVVPVMAGLGFEPEDVGHGNHDGFQKPPIFNFELHRTLFQPENDFKGPFANPWERAVPDAPGSAGYHLQDSDLYLYLIAHAYKHHSHSGTGIRSAVDEYVELGHLDLDRAYVDGWLEEMGLAAFERELRQAALEAFGEAGRAAALPALSEATEALLRGMLRAGTYGTLDLAVDHRLEQVAGEKGRLGVLGKARYLLDRVNMPERQRLAYYPVLGRYAILRPAFYVARAAKAAAKLPTVLSELRRVRRFRG